VADIGIARPVPGVGSYGGKTAGILPGLVLAE
jgi:hypothetical protein